MLTLGDHGLVVLITVGLPLYALVIWHRRLLRASPQRRSQVRMETYKTGVVVPWSITLLTLLFWSRAERPWPDLGLGLALGLGFWTALAIAGALVAFATWQRLSLHENEEAEEEITRQLGNVEPLLPRTVREFRWFTAVALTAGICEEILYRGFVIFYLAELVSLPAAAVVSSMLFGMAHAYQGTRGILQTGVVGLALAGVYLLCGSIWIPMFIHAFIDINSGLLAYEVLRKGAHLGNWPTQDNPDQPSD